MSMTPGKLTFLFCCYFSICVCAYPHLSMWSFYIEFEADNHKMVYTIRATGTSHIRTVPNYNHVATTYGYVTYFTQIIPFNLGCVLFGSLCSGGSRSARSPRPDY